MHTEYPLKVKGFIRFANEVNVTEIKANVDNDRAVTIRGT